MPSRVYSTRAGTALECALPAGSAVTTLIVDNTTSRYAYCQEANAYIAPGALRYLITLPAGAQTAHLTWQPPPGVIEPPLDTRQILAATAYDAADNPASSAAQGQFSAGAPQQTLGVIAAGQTLSFPLPTGTVGIALITDTNVTSASATGDQTGIVYLQQLPYSQQLGAVASGEAAPVWASIDTSVTVRSVGGVSRLVALFTLAAVDVTGNGPGGTVVTSRGPAIRSLPFAVSNLGAGAISPSLGNFTYLRRLIVVVDTGAASLIVYALTSADGTVNYVTLAARFLAGTGPPAVVVEFDDLPLAPGTGGTYRLAISNNAGSTGPASFYGTVLGS